MTLVMDGLVVASWQVLTLLVGGGGGGSPSVAGCI